jgi:hypothetical protein
LRPRLFRAGLSQRVPASSSCIESPSSPLVPMNLRALLAMLNDRWRRPDSTPTALSLLTIGALLMITLLLPDQGSECTATAAEVQRITVTPAKPNRPTSLRDRLVVGLQARLKSEVEFIELVDARVRTGQLPQRVVDETFFWARSRAAAVRSGRPRRPIIYFQPAMLARAQRLRVSL